MTCSGIRAQAGPAPATRSSERPSSAPVSGSTATRRGCTAPPAATAPTPACGLVYTVGSPNAASFPRARLDAGSADRRAAHQLDLPARGAAVTGPAEPNAFRRRQRAAAVGTRRPPRRSSTSAARGLRRTAPHTYIVGPRLDVLSDNQRSAVLGTVDQSRPLTVAYANALLTAITARTSDAPDRDHTGGDDPAQGELRRRGLLQADHRPDRIEVSSEVLQPPLPRSPDQLLTPASPAGHLPGAPAVSWLALNVRKRRTSCTISGGETSVT